MANFHGLTLFPELLSSGFIEEASATRTSTGDPVS